MDQGVETLTKYFLDTNAIIFLFSKNLEQFSDEILAKIEKYDLFVSPLVQLELQYLFEIGRIKSSGDHVLQALYKEIGLKIASLPLDLLIQNAVEESWTRDPFDRLITAHAKTEKAFLITSDKVIRRFYKKAIW